MTTRIAAAVVLVALFIVSRVALLVTSYDVNQNWEEPVFLFSASELARSGVADVFDHQDDLNHGGSVALLLLAVPWLRVAGTSLVTLKGVAILWSTLTLVAFLVVGWRYFSPRAALVWGVCYVALSPTLARLNVTLVGSHPEALLPSALALAAYLEWVRRRSTASSESWALAVALGACCGLATWMSYSALMFVVPLLVLRVAFAERASTLAGVVVGAVAGFAPWLYQNLWLRPQGALLWRSHVASGASGPPIDRAGHALAELAASFGFASSGGWLILAACAVALAASTIVLLVPRWRMRAPWPVLSVAPLVAAAYLGFALLVAARIPVYPGEDYYHYRFYVPLQAALFWVLALAVDQVAPALGRVPLMLAAAALVVAAVRSQAALYGQGNHYQPDFARDRALGCHIFGIAESDRSPDWATAIARLGRLPDVVCRERAFTGLGWGIGERYVQSRDLEAARLTLTAIPELRLRSLACGGFDFLVNHTVDLLTPAERAAAVKGIESVCL